MSNNPQTVFLTPRPGLLVLNPDTGKPLAPDGEHLVKTVYWRRRIREGAVSESKPAAAPAAPVPQPQEF